MLYVFGTQCTYVYFASKPKMRINAKTDKTEKKQQISDHIQITKNKQKACQSHLTYGKQLIKQKLCRRKTEYLENNPNHVK